MKKSACIIATFISLSSFSQNLIQNNLNGLNQNFMQAQNMQIYASNVRSHNLKANKPTSVRTGSRAVQRTRSINTIQRHQIKRRITSTNNVIQHPAQTNQVQINPATSAENNDGLQQQGNFAQMKNNVGNAFGNEANPPIQMALGEIPAIQLRGINMELNINLQNIGLKRVRFSGSGLRSSGNNGRKLLPIKKRLIKFNRKTSGKLSFKKRLKIKVDDCFKW